jgi:hypothetical protein
MDLVLLGDKKWIEIQFCRLSWHLLSAAERSRTLSVFPAPFSKESGFFFVPLPAYVHLKPTRSDSWLVRSNILLMKNNGI